MVLNIRGNTRESNLKQKDKDKKSKPKISHPTAKEGEVIRLTRVVCEMPLFKNVREDCHSGYSALHGDAWLVSPLVCTLIRGYEDTESRFGKISPELSLFGRSTRSILKPY